MQGVNCEFKDIPSVVVQEAYKTLRSNIQFCSMNRDIKSITITSCNPGDGKTTTSINLGISMAKAGKRVLLVDADLRKPMLLKQNWCNCSEGLSNYLSGYANLDEVTNITNIENFFYIGSGPMPPNPAELLGMRRFEEFIETVESIYDVIIIDTPPLGGMIDSAIIAARTNATIIVIKSNSVEYGSAKRIKEQLEKANAKVLGVILNKVPKKDYKAYYSYYNYYSVTNQADKVRSKKQKEEEKE